MVDCPVGLLEGGVEGCPVGLRVGGAMGRPDGCPVGLDVGSGDVLHDVGSQRHISGNSLDTVWQA